MDTILFSTTSDFYPEKVDQNMALTWKHEYVARSGFFFTINGLAYLQQVVMGLLTARYLNTHFANQK